MLVEELLERENIRYRKAGKDVLVKCLSPDHEDNNPSMRVDKITGAFNCFSCGFKGNIYTHFDESIDLVGIKVIQLKKKISEVLSNELSLPKGRESFKRKHRGIAAETYEYFEAFTHDDYDGRIVFPIYDISGRLLSCLGRFAFSDAKPKYLWDPPIAQTPVYPPKPETHQSSVVVVEGIFDVLNLWDKGMKNVVCTFGKNMGSTKKQQRRLRNMEQFIPLKIQGVKKLYILYDSGAWNDAEALANLLKDLFIVEVVKYPEFSDEKDAGNLTREEVDELKRFIYEKE